ncbi:uncharacterized protein PHALS_01628 [Plasmopara halstedii]|uniref:Uncharacterized protein n=1 Tax=Plasmopara halstedii TaxID=4781 RepID=A0A0N7L6V4_PLAHL|nr:uncharacterized protein PHALS_01628 [Plasmopara halstedii]CEG45323.1 hypothetical protein PHALS_01628 [Plasmopara halstedii]|eukprot:XP_024581692.1 hypothetical protein PHALS_01628 [Plasmopara halstedii]
MVFVRKPFTTTIAAAVSLSLVAADSTVSILGDATYTIPSSRGEICGGYSSGTACPLKGDVAVADCNEGLQSYTDGKCIALSDAECILVAGTTLKCVYPTNEVFENVDTPYKNADQRSIDGGSTSYVSSASASGCGDAEVTYPEEEQVTYVHDLSHSKLIESLTPDTFESNNNQVMQYLTEENKSHESSSPLSYNFNGVEDHSIPTPSYGNVNANLVQKVFGSSSKRSNNDYGQNGQEHTKYKKGDLKRFTNGSNDYGNRPSTKDNKASKSNATLYPLKSDEVQIPSYQTPSYKAHEEYASKSLRGNNYNNFASYFHLPDIGSKFFETDRSTNEGHRSDESGYSNTKNPIVRSSDHQVQTPCTPPPATTSVPTETILFTSAPPISPEATSTAEDEVDLTPLTRPAAPSHMAYTSSPITTDPIPSLAPEDTSISESTYIPTNSPETTLVPDGTSTPTIAPNSLSPLTESTATPESLTIAPQFTSSPVAAPLSTIIPEGTSTPESSHTPTDAPKTTLAPEGTSTSSTQSTTPNSSSPTTETTPTPEGSSPSSAPTTSPDSSSPSTGPTPALELSTIAPQFTSKPAATLPLITIPEGTSTPESSPTPIDAPKTTLAPEGTSTPSTQSTTPNSSSPTTETTPAPEESSPSSAPTTAPESSSPSTGSTPALELSTIAPQFTSRPTAAPPSFTYPPMEIVF